MGLEDLRKNLASKKSKPLTINDVWHDGMIVDPYFHDIALFVAEKGHAIVDDVSRKFKINGSRLEAVLTELVEYRVAMFQKGEYKAIVLPSMLKRYFNRYSLKYEISKEQNTEDVKRPIEKVEVKKPIPVVRATAHIVQPAVPKEPAVIADISKQESEKVVDIVSPGSMPLSKRVEAVLSSRNGYAYDRLPPNFIETYHYFCLWRLEVRNGDPKPTKVPYDPNTLQRGSSADMTKHSKFAFCLNQWNSLPSRDGIGIGIGLFDDLCGIDIDHCIDENNQVLDFAQDIINTVNSYTEISPSGTGIRIICRIPRLQYDKSLYLFKNTELGLEMYPAGQTKRFVTLTGWSLFEDRDVVVRTNEVQILLDKYMRRKEPKKKASAVKHVDFDVDFEDQSFPERFTDEQIIGWLRSNPKYDLLWQGKWQGLYPSQSEGDCAFVGQLAYFTDRNPKQMDRIYRKSGLMRPKWDDRRVDSTVGKNLIKYVIDGCEESLSEMLIRKSHESISDALRSINEQMTQETVIELGSCVGAQIQYENGSSRNMYYRIVSQSDVGMVDGYICISVESIIGSALFGHRIGETVNVVTPSGNLYITILNIDGELADDSADDHRDYDISDAPPSVPSVSNSGNPWTPEEDQQLIDEFKLGWKASTIALKHERSTESIKSRIRYLRNHPNVSYAKKSGVFQNVGSRWSDEEDTQLLNEYYSGMSINDMCVRHCRKRGGIVSRLSKLTGQKRQDLFPIVEKN